MIIMTTMRLCQAAEVTRAMVSYLEEAGQPRPFRAPTDDRRGPDCYEARESIATCSTRPTAAGELHAQRTEPSTQSCALPFAGDPVHVEHGHNAVMLPLRAWSAKACASP